MQPLTIASSSEDKLDSLEELKSSSSQSSDSNDSIDLVNESAINVNEVNKNATNQSNDCKYSTDRRATDQIETKEEPIFKLAWSTRDEINASLNRYTQLLCGEKAEAGLAKDNLMNDNVNLYQVLLNLPPKSDTSAKSCHLGRVTLDLDSEIRSQIIATLLGNHSLVAYEHLASEEDKIKMIERNNDLAIELMKLPFSVIADESWALNGKLV